MGSTFDKAQEYAKLFMWKNKTRLLTIFTAHMCILMKTTSKLYVQWISNKIFYPSTTNPKNMGDMFIYIPVSIFYSITIPSLEIISHFFENSFMADMFCNLYKKFLEYSFVDWKGYLKCDLYSAIIRRTKGTVQFFKETLIDSADNLLYAVIGIGRLLILYGFPQHFAVGFLMAICFPIVVNLVTVFRKIALRKMNEAHDIAEAKLKDIFLNYEMIQTYNTFDKEMQNYEEASFEWEFWITVYWLVDNTITFSNRSMKVILFYVMAIVMKKNNIMMGMDVIDQMKTFNSVIRRIASFTTNMKLVMEAAENMTESKLDSLKPSQQKRIVKKNTIEEGLEVREMRVSYGERLVFEDVNLRIEKGQKIAITGPNGSGKSTFVRALLGIERHEGTVLVDGIDRMLFEAKSLGRIFTYVPQDPAVFEATVQDNITSFQEKIQGEEILRQVAEYSMDDEMKAIGYETMLIEKGKNISAAQRQKICFLRAAFRDSAVVVFDEMTSEMDEKYEALLIDLFMKKMQEKTVIMIIHNLNLLEKFDGIVFFNNKTAVGCKNYKELIEENQDFRRYCTGESDI